MENENILALQLLHTTGENYGMNKLRKAHIKGVHYRRI